MLFLMLGMIVFTACGSKMDKTAEEFKDSIIKEKSDRDHKDYQDNVFSFLIYKDKDTNEYLAKALVPYEGEPNSVESKYFYNVNKELESIEPFSGGRTFDYVKSHGNYEVVYKSGKFK
ncbi:hypothetical protein ACFJYO_14860, partial [Enterococcus faecalis]